MILHAIDKNAISLKKGVKNTSFL